MTPTLVIMTGPQGAGNHLFSKALGQNPELCGWQQLQQQYWEGHDREPFAECWNDPTKLNKFDWGQSNYFITSVSCPYFNNGVETLPNYHLFVAYARECVNVRVLVLGRDQTILGYQQTRVRSKHTTPAFIDKMQELLLYNPTFASQELLYLYRLPYLNWLEQQLGLPVTSDGTVLETILQHDANEKYISAVESHWLDDVAKTASSKWY